MGLEDGGAEGREARGFFTVVTSARVVQEVSENQGKHTGPSSKWCSLTVGLRTKSKTRARQENLQRCKGEADVGDSLSVLRDSWILHMLVVVAEAIESCDTGDWRIFDCAFRLAPAGFRRASLGYHAAVRLGGPSDVPLNTVFLVALRVPRCGSIDSFLGEFQCAVPHPTHPPTHLRSPGPVTDCVLLAVIQRIAKARGPGTVGVTTVDCHATGLTAEEDTSRSSGELNNGHTDSVADSGRWRQVIEARRVLVGAGRHACPLAADLNGFTIHISGVLADHTGRGGGYNTVPHRMVR